MRSATSACTRNTMRSGSGGLGREGANLLQDARAVVVRRGAPGNRGDVGKHRFEDVARGAVAQVHDVAQDALLAEPLAARPAGVGQSIREETQNGLAALALLDEFLPAIAKPERA